MIFHAIGSMECIAQHNLTAESQRLVAILW